VVINKKTDDNKKSGDLRLLFSLHSLPETNTSGYVDDATMDSMIQKVYSRSWFMMVGTSGSGKTRHIYELFCKIYGIFLTFDTAENSKNIGSQDLDQAAYSMRLEQNDPKASEKALRRTRSVIAARLFVLDKILSLYSQECFTPRLWLLIQLLPEIGRAHV